MSTTPLNSSTMTSLLVLTRSGQCYQPAHGGTYAVHYGCHLTKPHKDREFEKEVMLNTEHPTWMEELVAALGATPVEYRNKMQCCGAVAACEAMILFMRWISPTRRSLTSKK